MIVFPMAGTSSRFFDAGYKLPKYMLRIQQKTVFAHVLDGFKSYFGREKFLFICRSDYQTPEFIDFELQRLGMPGSGYEIAILHANTRGQADSVALGLQQVPHNAFDDLTIFNIDTVRDRFEKKAFGAASDGYLEVFTCSGNHWSFVRPAERSGRSVGKVLQVAEKERISTLGSNGLYYFSSISLFKELFAIELALGVESWAMGELYVAPLFQRGIEKGCVFNYSICQPELLRFCGTPEEYESWLNEKKC